MGIHGIYKEIGPGQRVALSKLAIEHFEKFGRPLRIAIDISIWLFQIQSSKGGTNPALRTFYYRLLRLISHSIHPLFVFDGPNKPPFKRNKRTGPNVASIPEFLAKQLLKQFGIPFHLAPGEAEAECALLQREGIVDAVLSEDVDTLMFGSGLTFRNWSPEASKSNKVPTHINLYDAQVTKSGSGMDREGMILVALMSGGDYVPEGIPGCGPKTACEAARAGFGAELCKISRRNKDGLRAWKDKLMHELHTNERRHFKTKHKKLSIPDDFPDPEVLGYYTHPVISNAEKLERLRQSLKWDQDIDFISLRSFTEDAFDWTKLGGAKKFIRNLAPALLIRELRTKTGGTTITAKEELKLVKAIHGIRNHVSTDGMTELRITFTPHEVVPIDLDAEEPDDEINNDSSDDEGALVLEGEVPASPSKRRAPSNYDPTQMEKIWLSETLVKVGVPIKFQEYENSTKHARALLETRNANREARKAAPPRKKTKSNDMPQGALDRFTQVTKPGIANTMLTGSQDAIPGPKKQPDNRARVAKSGLSSIAPSASEASSPGSRKYRWMGNNVLQAVQEDQPQALAAAPTQHEVVEILSSPPQIPRRRSSDNISSFHLDNECTDLLPPTVTKRRRSPLRRAQTDSAMLNMNEEDLTRTPMAIRQRMLPSSPCSLPSPSQLFPPAKKTRLPTHGGVGSQRPRTPQKRVDAPREEISLISSSPARQTSLDQWFSPKRSKPAPMTHRAALPTIHDSLDLTMSSPRKLPTRQSPRIAEQRGKRRTTPPMMEKETSPSQIVRNNTTFNVPPAKTTTKRPVGQTSTQATLSLPIKKQVYRIRDSLPGTFAVEELDLSNHVGSERVKLPGKRGKLIFNEELSVLDLTGGA